MKKATICEWNNNNSNEFMSGEDQEALFAALHILQGGEYPLDAWCSIEKESVSIVASTLYEDASYGRYRSLQFGDAAKAAQIVLDQWTKIENVY